MKAPKRILILGGDADANLGDRAILISMCQELRAVAPDVVLTVVSSKPERSSDVFGAKVVMRGPRGFLSLCAEAVRSDMVVCGGGGLFQDDDSLVKMPYWGMRVALVRALCRRVVGVSLGVGPLRWLTSRWFARLAFACMERISVRDHEARRTAASITRKRVEVVPDPALLLPPAEESRARDWLRGQGVDVAGHVLVGVAPRRWFPPKARIVPHRVAAKLRRGSMRNLESQRLTDLLAASLDDLVQRRNAFVVFMPTYNVAHEADDVVSEEVLSKMNSPRGRVLRIGDPCLYKAVAGLLDVFLGGRMHAGMLAASMGTPLVGLAYNQKFHGFFEQMGLRQYLLDVDLFVREARWEQLAEMLDRAMRERPPVRERAAQLGLGFRAFSRVLLESTQ